MAPLPEKAGFRAGPGEPPTSARAVRRRRALLASGRGAGGDCRHLRPRSPPAPLTPPPTPASPRAPSAGGVSRKKAPAAGPSPGCLRPRACRPSRLAAPYAESADVPPQNSSSCQVWPRPSLATVSGKRQDGRPSVLLIPYSPHPARGCRVCPFSPISSQTPPLSLLQQPDIRSPVPLITPLDFQNLSPSDPHQDAVT